MPTVLFAICLVAVAAPSLAYEEVAIESPGGIQGRVSFNGKRPAPAYLPVLQNADVCGERVLDDSLVVGAEGGLRDVVVELLGVKAGKPPEPAPAILDNQACVFVPRVQALVVGQSVEIRNSDPILHDAHAWLGSKTVFNLGLPEWRRVSHEFTEPGLHAIDCNVLHTWMKAYVFVAEHPYVAVTGDDGRFLLEDVPPGAYELRFWHEKLGATKRRVTVPPGQVVETELRLPTG